MYVYTTTMSTTIADRARDALTTLGELVGLIPRDLRPDFDRAGFHLPRTAFAPAVRRKCSALTAKGVPCKNSASPNCDVCMRHYRKSAAAVNETETRMYCTETTAKGTQCKCRAFRGFEFCHGHAKKKGLVTIPTDCPICYEAMTSKDRTKTKCGHYFHTACLKTLCESRSTTIRVRGKLRYRAPCPMCRVPFTMAYTPPPPPYWIGADPPTYSTSGAEWVTRLDVIPMSPMITRETLEIAARAAGEMLLEWVHRHDEYPGDTTMSMILGLHGITRR